MNRQIKFRIWNTFLNRWEKDLKLSHLGHVFPSVGSVNNDHLVVQQFTGQLDIEDNEMYEGDLVELYLSSQDALKPKLAKEAAGLYEIFWNRSGFYLRIHKKNWFDVMFGNPDANKNLEEGEPPHAIIDKLPLENFGVCLVVGNIYDTPELLKRNL